MHSLGQRIKQRRLELQMTQQELGGDELTKSFISQVEKGQCMPSIRSLEVIARRLGKRPSWFLDGGLGDREKTHPTVEHQRSGSSFKSQGKK